MDLFDAIAKRYSYRGTFTDAPVPREDLIQIVQAGIQSPSACNEQIASFAIIDEPALRGEIARLLDRPVCNTARAMIACIADPRPVFAGISFAAEDCGAAVENMLLAITALGYATVWLDGALRRDGIAERINHLLAVPPGQSIRILLPIGVPASPGQQREKFPFTQRAWFNRRGKV
jgi:nitroreductase